MATGTETLAELFMAYVKAAIKQKTILNKIKNNDIDSAIHEVYDSESFKDFIKTTVIPSAYKAKNFVKSKAIELSCQKFTNTTEKMIKINYQSAKDDLMKGIQDYIGCPVKFDGKSVYVNDEVKPGVADKLLIVNGFLKDNNQFIINSESDSQAISSEIYQQSDGFESWFKDHVLVDPANPNSENGVLINF